MIKVLDQETKTGCMIEIVGAIRNYTRTFGVKVGVVGDWTVERGRSAGKGKSGVKWGRVMYCGNLKQALDAVSEEISTNFGIPKEELEFKGIEGWNKAIKEMAVIKSMIEKIHLELNSTLLKMKTSSNDSEEAEEDVEDDEPEETPEDSDDE